MATKKFKCTVCGYIHEGKAAPETCPVCAAPASAFVEIEDAKKKGMLSDKNGIRVYKTYLSTLKAGTYTAELTFEDGSKAAIGLAVSNSAQSAVSPNQITFDKYEQSANHADQTVNVVLPAGTRLDSIKIGSTVLERGTDYTYNATNGTIRLLKESLAK